MADDAKPRRPLPEGIVSALIFLALLFVAHHFGWTPPLPPSLGLLNPPAASTSSAQPASAR